MRDDLLTADHLVLIIPQHLQSSSEAGDTPLEGSGPIEHART
ncbi:hypothetical protein Rleg_5421 (plasmid) [Rhizobium leguminosarum bv. trifolii WSM1325]|uniref:Uncharacterized protein n=1 Tax=Rhizobium leguminosarum bv. trifolii (strain WSM1325) TaxID=395491 RepID=C6B8L0_RHILS|nr:hypothetical protein Rleg_5421 [Rhizobium leguminosarum bv. trifolii WSM1325]